MLASCRLDRMGKNIRRNWKEQVTFNKNGKFCKKVTQNTSQYIWNHIYLLDLPISSSIFELVI